MQPVIPAKAGIHYTPATIRRVPCVSPPPSFPRKRESSDFPGNVSIFGKEAVDSRFRGNDGGGRGYGRADVGMAGRTQVWPGQRRYGRSDAGMIGADAGITGQGD